ncbi:MAG TPA: Maf family nucleotide pyrophosphatase [Steroidobacteraceae bacterium]
MPNPPRLILASGSRYRRELLGRLGLHFEVHSPGMDESVRAGEAPAERARRLALAKALALAPSHADAVLIGSDQVAVCGGELLHKPGNPARCAAQLRQLSGNEAVFYTAVAVAGPAATTPLQFLDTTTVEFRALSDAEIERYIAAEQPFDCAGGIRSERLGIGLFKRVQSEDPTGMIGLPLIGLAAALRSRGYAIP